MCKATYYWLDVTGFYPRLGRGRGETHSSRPAPRPHQALVKWVAVFFPRGKAAEAWFLTTRPPLAAGSNMDIVITLRPFRVRLPCNGAAFTLTVLISHHKIKKTRLLITDQLLTFLSSTVLIFIWHTIWYYQLCVKLATVRLNFTPNRSYTEASSENNHPSSLNVVQGTLKLQGMYLHTTSSKRHCNVE